MENFKLLTPEEVEETKKKEELEKKERRNINRRFNYHTKRFDQLLGKFNSIGAEREDRLWKLENPTYPKDKKAEFEKILGRENFAPLEKAIVDIVDEMGNLGCLNVDIANAIDYIIGFHYF